MSDRVAALLRAVNVGGVKVPSADLRAAADDAGLADPVTHLATGNLVVGRSAGTTSADVGARVTAALADRLGVEVDVTVRTHAALRAVVDAVPFPDAARDDPSHLVVLFHPAPTTVPAGEVDLAGVTGAGRERLWAAGDVTYAWYRDGIGTSGLTAPRLARLLGTWGTGRNWNTVRRLVELTAG
ncbi:uncharacterized protein (DUF1697 family) [Sediminihabitans luteus]|uniref:Uncharacterized protein (DUF1697 family) n=1 Tax=Sediminihabitans luteus TaxID=1138585 RepID=A0A2M9CYW9_9CELL|nr:DUF1697 domain-containing protein [Sediminihabitans luteus]PJJ77053.1 uncharacterized protein (DUF1697 family) [Sediminihabitans luteus]GIJ00428.1 hypothetical protein Slu03_28050 [Sediminihabitans luteus]